tara:strand:+ start:1604 stop:1795 length:192 start_codon:yes stop_codon:yes gene_type:complete
MKIKLICGRAGPTFCQKAGDVIDVSGDEGKSLIAAGQGVAVKGGSATGAAPSSKPKKKADNEN